jgi:carboxypeptidase D
MKLLLPWVALSLIRTIHAQYPNWHAQRTLLATLRSDPHPPDRRRAADDLETLVVNDNVTVRFKHSRICETTEGVGSYSGYVDLGEGSHSFFWFFEARKNVETAPITLWLNGGPGSDSLIGLFNGL